MGKIKDLAINKMLFIKKDKRVNKILKKFKDGEVTLGEANSLILRNDKVVCPQLMCEILQTINPNKQNHASNNR